MFREYFPINALVGGVVTQAMRDAARGDLDAMSWLLTDGPVYFEAIDFAISGGMLLTWLDKGCPLSLVASRRKK